MIARFYHSWLAPLSTRLHFIVIYMVLLAVSYNYHWLFLGVVVYLIVIYRKKFITKRIVFFLLIYTFLFLAILSWPFESDSISGVVRVLEVDENKLSFMYRGRKYLAYGSYSYLPGDILYLEADSLEITRASFSGDFDEYMYLKANNYGGKYVITSSTYLRTSFSLMRWKEQILTHYQSKMSEKSYTYFATLVFGEGSLGSSDTYTRINLAHILVLSGFHLTLIYKVCEKVVIGVTKDFILSENISLTLCFLYSLLCGMSPSLLRAFLAIFIMKMNARYNVGLSGVDKYSLCFIIMAFNVNYLFNLSFILSQLAALALVFKKEFIGTKSGLKGSLLTTIYMFGFTFPFITNINNEISLFFILTFIFQDIFAYFIIPFCFGLLIFPGLGSLLELALVSLENGLVFMGSFFVIDIPYMSAIFKGIYYFLYLSLLVLILRKKCIVRMAMVLGSFMVLFFNWHYLSPACVEFIDVGQGDACLIKVNQNYILIDCFQAYEYLQKRGIRKLASIFITHSDQDHVGDLDLLLENLEVRQLYTNINEERKLEQQFKRDFQGLKAGDIVRVSELDFQILSPDQRYEDDNANSLVLYFYYQNNYFLLMGDATIENEKYIMNAYSNLKVDILKVGHHGSNTSSSYTFLEYVNFRYAIVSVGANNYYGLPDAEVISKLNSISQVYETRYCGNIVVIKDKIKSYK